MHPKAAIVMLLLVLALCRCGVGGPGRNSRKDKPGSRSMGFTLPPEQQTTMPFIPPPLDDAGALAHARNANNQLTFIPEDFANHQTYALNSSDFPFIPEDFGPSRPIARVLPPNVSPQNANIGRNNARSAFQRYNGGFNRGSGTSSSSTFGASNSNTSVKASRSNELKTQKFLPGDYAL